MPNVQFDKLAVIIPAYNAQETLPTLITKLLLFVHAANILIVDDGSTDGTAEVARRQGVEVLRHERNLGKGGALRSGFNVVKQKNDVEAVVTMDADLQHKPEDVPIFVDKMNSTGAEIVIGRRKRIGTAMPFHRRLSNTITSFLVTVRTGMPILDSQCGFRLIQRRVLANVHLDSTGFEAETELLIKAAKLGFKVEFVPIDTLYRGETSHMRNWMTVQNFVKVLLKEY